ncbi:hypothetical protein ACFV3R_16195 [Streptomyces sp. NPDC059740]|uniref:hypothetical protein n=1 Tax=Streptomyces sp. NPDC059740 TaxID=3346926 RepID=UPI00364A5313
MQMSEGFATTAAALAPVVWAIGTIEVQQLSRRLRAWNDEMLQDYNEAHVAMAEAADRGSLARAREGWESARTGWTRRPLPPFGLYGLWLSLSTSMVACTATALRWLCEDGGPGKESGPASGNARFIFWAITLALAFITLLPGYVVTLDSIRAQKRLKGARMAITRLEDEAERRVHRNEDREPREASY